MIVKYLLNIFILLDSDSPRQYLSGGILYVWFGLDLADVWPLH